VLPPGGEGAIKVTLHPKGNQTNIEKRIVVHSNDPQQPEFALTMRGHLLVDLVAQPTFVHIRDLTRNEAGTGTFELQLMDTSKAEIQSVTLEDEKNFSLKKIEADSDADATYEVRFRGAKEVGTATTRVVVKTNGEYTPELFIPVRANVSLNLRYQKNIRFIRRKGGIQERTFRISALRGDAPKIKKVEDPDGLLEIEVLESQGPMANIRMRVLEDELPADDDGKSHPLILRTSDRDEPRIELEYSVLPPTKKALSKDEAAAAKITPVRATATDPATDAL
jgi:hypothetical protein